MVVRLFYLNNDGEVMSPFIKRSNENGKKKSPFVLLCIPEDGCFYRSRLLKRLFESDFNGEWNGVFSFILGYVGIELHVSVSSCVANATIVAYVITQHVFLNVLCGLKGAYWILCTYTSFPSLYQVYII